MRKKVGSIFIAGILLVGFLLAGCNMDTTTLSGDARNMVVSSSVEAQQEETTDLDFATADEPEEAGEEILSEIPDWDGKPYVEFHGNEPEFAESEILDRAAERLDPLDELGRCGTATACIGVEGMPTGERGDISQVIPTGWQTSVYDFIENEYLYNRCHLIGWQLSGDDAIPRNLITGTRYMNTEGMLPFENRIAGYVRGTENHVMYRVQPVFHEEELVARGVLLEAQSVEDEGKGLSFAVFCYNVQPGVKIDYTDGSNERDESTDLAANAISDGEETEMNYILNTNTKAFHYPTCPSVKQMKAKNTEKFHGTRSEAIDRGFHPCGNCNP